MRKILAETKNFGEAKNLDETTFALEFSDFP
jgi:hypothetical protein